MKFKVYCIMAAISLSLLGCQKKGHIQPDYGLYIVDTYQILLLCEAGQGQGTQGNSNYQRALTDLKGNSVKWKKLTSEYGQLENDVQMGNALGVAYLRLREFDKAKIELEAALQKPHTDRQRACLLTNLAAVKYWLGDNEGAYGLFKEVADIPVGDVFTQLVVESNLVSSNRVRTDLSMRETVKIKKLLKREKELSGSNQLLGIFNYCSMGLYCYKEGQYGQSNGYMNTAIGLNDALGQDKYIEAELYRTLSYVNSDREETYGVAISAMTEAIEILGLSETGDYPDLIDYYAERGNLYLGSGQIQNAINDYNHVLDRCDPAGDLAATTHCNLGWAYYDMPDNGQAIKHFAAAYYIWDKLGIEGRSRREIRGTLMGLYGDMGLGPAEGFEGWFEGSQRPAEKDVSAKEEGHGES